jgi:hypothetical protein
MSKNIKTINEAGNITLEVWERFGIYGNSAMNTSNEILRTAAELVSIDRAKEHGDMLRNLENIAMLWRTYLTIRAATNSEKLNAHDVATMMELLKIARRLTGIFNSDDYIDGAGYAAIAFEVRSRKLEP